jgi:hypothetical protein
MILLVLVVPLWAQYTLPDIPATISGNKYFRGTYVPSSATSIATVDVLLMFLVFSNDDTSNTATIRVTDGTTNCGGSGCPVLPSVTLGPSTVYVVPLDSVGMYCPSGVKWQATGSSKVFGYGRLRY